MLKIESMNAEAMRKASTDDLLKSLNVLRGLSDLIGTSIWSNLGIDECGLYDRIDELKEELRDRGINEELIDMKY